MEDNWRIVSTVEGLYRPKSHRRHASLTTKMSNGFGWPQTQGFWAPCQFQIKCGRFNVGLLFLEAERGPLRICGLTVRICIVLARELVPNQCNMVTIRLHSSSSTGEIQSAYTVCTITALDHGNSEDKLVRQ